MRPYSHSSHNTPPVRDNSRQTSQSFDNALTANQAFQAPPAGATSRMTINSLPPEIIYGIIENNPAVNNGEFLQANRNLNSHAVGMAHHALSRANHAKHQLLPLTSQSAAVRNNQAGVSRAPAVPVESTPENIRVAKRSRRVLTANMKQISGGLAPDPNVFQVKKLETVSSTNTLSSAIRSVRDQDDFNAISRKSTVASIHNPVLNEMARSDLFFTLDNKQFATLAHLARQNNLIPQHLDVVRSDTFLSNAPTLHGHVTHLLYSAPRNPDVLELIISGNFGGFSTVFRQYGTRIIRNMRSNPAVIKSLFKGGIMSNLFNYDLQNIDTYLHHKMKFSPTARTFTALEFVAREIAAIDSAPIHDSAKVSRLEAAFNTAFGDEAPTLERSHNALAA